MHAITANKTTVALHKVRPTFNGCRNSGMFDWVYRQVHEPTSRKKKFCFFKDDELLQNAINAVYIKVI